MSDKPRNTSLAGIVLAGLGQLLQVLLFILLAIFAIISITEIAARNDYLGYLQNQIAASERIATNNDSTTTPRSEFIPLLEEVKRRVETLITVGADGPDQTLLHVRRGVEVVAEGTAKDSAALMEMFADFLGTAPPPARQTTLSSMLHMVRIPIDGFSSDYLLAIGIMTCAAIGAFVAAVRTTSIFSWRTILLGFSSGFIVFLAVKSGHRVFLLQVPGHIIQANPYSSVFVGLLAGMFTEKTFSLLALATDTIFQKLKKVIEQ